MKLYLGDQLSPVGNGVFFGVISSHRSEEYKFLSRDQFSPVVPASPLAYLLDVGLVVEDPVGRREGEGHVGHGPPGQGGGHQAGPGGGGQAEGGAKGQHLDGGGEREEDGLGRLGRVHQKRRAAAAACGGS